MAVNLSMGNNSQNNKRIARNTLMLYIRMVLTLGVGLYTSRVILRVLGIEDYGIYNIVGGVIVLFSFLNSALTQATQRFLTYELGRNDRQRFRQVFSISILVYLGLSIIIIGIGETAGLWFLNTKLNIDGDKIVEANWVYQFSIIAFFFNMMYTPYNAAIIAYEKMSFYAYTSIIEVLLKLFIVYLLILIEYDKLTVYAILVSLVSFVILCIYVTYCTYRFKECRFTFYWNKNMFLKLVSFSGWSMFGSLSVMAANQGVNLLLNIFFGVVVNAAMGITNQISNAINQLVLNIQVAFNPQITKSYAKGDREYWETLVFRSAKSSYLLLLLISFPFLIETDMILHIWLENVPPYTVSFCRLAVISLLIDALSGPLWILIQANGRIKKYQLIVGSVILLNLVLSYMMFYLGYNPNTALIIRCVICGVLLIIRLVLFVDMLNFPSVEFCKQVMLRVMLVTLLAAPFPLIISQYINGVTGLVITSITAFISIILFSYLIGMNANEKFFLKKYIYSKIK
ncbi:oligosaccharide flippase family protein [Bacteroides sp.]|uniref:oligosaccharide flippase family protein n=1 Tax=Bacteroides sp. TaxID=29523 RepID=UPI00262F1EA7|nr:oligosaccharide flippase family protein [Bacteroides sp.]MDD3040123.1 oligosaccharide flippase family protein [Bacteroides sp.]